MKTHYRLEIAVQQLHDVKQHEVYSFIAGGCEIAVSFLDFPDISVQPQRALPTSAATDGVLTYNTCHTAEFEAEASQLEPLLPTQCKCSLKHARHIQWDCLCPLSTTVDHTDFKNYRMINSQSGELAGYAQMACRIYPVSTTSPPQQQLPTAARSVGDSSTAFDANPQQQQQPSCGVSTFPPPSSSPVPRPQANSNSGRPYIVRVVVDDSKARKAPREPSARSPGCGRGGNASHKASGAGAASARLPTAVNTAPANTFLYTLQYDIAYQLQSINEFLATTLKHDHGRLNAATLNDGAKVLTSKIDRTVEQITRLANIVLQVANQLVEDNPAPCYTGTTRDILPSRKEKESAAQLKRNPTNKLPTPKDATAASFLTYNVLYQLQCVGTNLFYMTAAYHDALNVSMSTVPKQHADFCEKLARETQKLSHHVNIMIQSSIDGKLGVDAASRKERPKRDKKGNAKEKHAVSSLPSSASSAKKGTSLPSSLASSRSTSSSSSSFSSSSSSSSSSASSPFRRNSNKSLAAVSLQSLSGLSPPPHPQQSPLHVSSLPVSSPLSLQQPPPPNPSAAPAAPAVPVTPSIPAVAARPTGSAGAQGAELTPLLQPSSSPAALADIPTPAPFTFTFTTTPAAPAPPPLAPVPVPVSPPAIFTAPTSPSVSTIPVPIPAPALAPVSVPTPMALPVPQGSAPPAAPPPVPVPIPFSS